MNNLPGTRRRQTTITVTAFLTVCAALSLWFAWRRLPATTRTSCGAIPSASAGLHPRAGAGVNPRVAHTAARPVAAGIPPPAQDIMRQPQATGPHVVIDIPSRTLTLYMDGKPARKHPVAVGKPGWASPVGEWRVTRKDRDWGGGFGTRWLGLNVPWGIYGIHGTNKDWSIGGAESHGCFRMHNTNVEDLWELVSVGTPVTIRGPWDFPFWEVPARPPFLPGQNGQAVVYLQLLLREAGFDPGEANGTLNAGTEEALRAFRRFYGLGPEGIADRSALLLLLGHESF